MQVVGEEQDQMITGGTRLVATRASIIFLRTGQPIQRFQVDQWKYLMASDDLIVTIKRAAGFRFADSRARTRGSGVPARIANSRRERAWQPPRPTWGHGGTLLRETET